MSPIILKPRLGHICPKHRGYFVGHSIILLNLIEDPLLALLLRNTVEHDFNGHEVNGIHEVNGKKYHDRVFHFVNKMHDFKGIHDLSGIFCYDDFFRKTHARL